MDAEVRSCIQLIQKISLQPLILSKPKIDQPLYLCLSVSNVAIANTLVREDARQHVIYFVNKVLQGPKI